MLSVNCQNCHVTDAFKPASKFDHAKAKFQLKSKHIEVACDKCHIKSVRNGKNFQQFTGLQFKSCANCHKDPHENKFGPDCAQCHSEESFKAVKSIGQFDHSKTGYPLTGRHIQLACKLCHKAGITEHVRHEQCIDCHKDYHKGQFKQDGEIRDCSDCHDVNGFSSFSFSIEKHNLTKFKLEGSHLATPCFECHKKEKDWNFREVGNNCVDCHKDIHKDFLDEKYYPAQRCENCHDVKSWREIQFDHQQTSFKLEGIHARTTCRKCHFKPGSNDEYEQKFAKLGGNCENCHTDAHHEQFRINDKNECHRCHGFENWKPEKFNHNTTRFKLDGGHKDVACDKCHKLVSQGDIKFVNYKFKDILCATCHLQ
jgi:nitrate/TMAO reductase-like tetraheme cytochrome c subunit